MSAELIKVEAEPVFHSAAYLPYPWSEAGMVNDVASGSNPRFIGRESLPPIDAEVSNVDTPE